MSAQLAPKTALPADNLFDAAQAAATSIAAAAKAPVLTEAEITLRVERMVAASDMEPLTSMADSLRVIPEVLRPRVSATADRLLRAEFDRLARETLADPTSGLAKGDGWVNPARTPRMMLGTAKLFAASSVGHMASQPWHLADAATLKAIGVEMGKGGGLECARKVLMSTKPLNLFVAATDMDDRSSYLKSVAAAVKGRKVHNVVLDAELIEWHPEKEFLEACELIGMRPMYVGIVDRKRMLGHSMLNPATTSDAIPLLSIDSDGRPFTYQAEKPAPAAVAAAAAPRQGAAAPVDNVVAMPPSNAMRDKIRALQSRQGRQRTNAGA